MAFTNTKYDNCAYKKELQESVSPLDYMLNPGNRRCSRSYSDYHSNGNNFVVDNYPNSNGAQTDIESELRLLNQLQSRCPSVKHQGDNIGYQNNIRNIRYTSTESLFTNPKCNYKELSTSGITFINMGVKPKYNNCLVYGRNTRNEAKDNYKPCLTSPVDGSESLPHSMKVKPSTKCSCK